MGFGEEEEELVVTLVRVVAARDFERTWRRTMRALRSHVEPRVGGAYAALPKPR